MSSLAGISEFVKSKSMGAFADSENSVELDDFESLAQGAGAIYKYYWVSLTFVNPEVQTRFIQCELEGLRLERS